MTILHLLFIAFGLFSGILGMLIGLQLSRIFNKREGD